jgi:uncharacterized protein (DUF486 family)
MVRGMKVLKLLVFSVFSISFLTGPHKAGAVRALSAVLRSAVRLLPH